MLIQKNSLRHADKIFFSLCFFLLMGVSSCEDNDNIYTQAGCIKRPFHPEGCTADGNACTGAGGSCKDVRNPSGNASLTTCTCVTPKAKKVLHYSDAEEVSLVSTSINTQVALRSVNTLASTNRISASEKAGLMEFYYNLGSNVVNTQNFVVTAPMAIMALSFFNEKFGATRALQIYNLILDQMDDDVTLQQPVAPQTPKGGAAVPNF
jgi:hypothetical protein